MKQLKLFGNIFWFVTALLFPQLALGEPSMSGYLKSRQQTINPINEIQASLIEQIDTDATCKHLTPTILLHYDNTYDKRCLKKQIKKAQKHKFKLTKKETVKKNALILTHYMRTIAPERQGELTNFVNVEVVVKCNKEKKCTHLYGYTFDDNTWKPNSQKEIEHSK